MQNKRLFNFLDSTEIYLNQLTSWKVPLLTQTIAAEGILFMRNMHKEELNACQQINV